MHLHKAALFALFVLLGANSGNLFAALPRLSVGRTAGANQAAVSWSSGGKLQQTFDLNVPFADAPDQSNPQLRSVTGANLFFRVSVPEAPWVPPVGIPYPPMGITNSHWQYTNIQYTFNYGLGPVPYRRNEFGPYTHYVDNRHPLAIDGTNTFGTPDRPRRTWVYPLPAGACVQVAGGVYNFGNGPSGAMVAGGAGTEELPIYVYGASTNRESMPIISRNSSLGFYQFGNWLTFERFSFTNGSFFNTRPQLKGAPVTNVVVRNCFFTATRGTGGNCFTTGGSSGNSSSNYTRDWVIFRNTVGGYGDYLSTNENDSTAAVLSENATNIWLLECTAFNMGGDGCRIGADQGGTPSGANYYVGRNHFYDNRENGLDVKQARHAVISENIMHGFWSGSSSAGEAIVIHYLPTDLWFFNNIVYDCERGINSTGVGTDCYVIGNLFYNILDRGIYLDRGGGTFYVANNTVDHCGAGIITGGNVTGVNYVNNIITDMTATSSTLNYHLQLESSVNASASTATNFLFFQNGGNIRIRWGGITYTSVAAWMAATGKGVGSRTLDPLYVNKPGADYRLSPLSPAINTALPIPNYGAALTASFGIPFDFRDLEDNTRMIGLDLLPDLGAYEYVPTITLP